MNYKLEKFWNTNNVSVDGKLTLWTINLKSFEILGKVKEEYQELYEL